MPNSLIKLLFGRFFDCADTKKRRAKEHEDHVM